MKTISVREAAAALGISTRAILYRREKGHLKGVLTKNNGVDEYRIYPNKEIIEGLRRIGSPLLTDNDFSTYEDRGIRREVGTAEHPQFETLAARVQELESALNKNVVDEGSATREFDEPIVLDAVFSEPAAEKLEDGIENDHLAHRNESLERKVQETIDLLMTPLIEKVQALTLESAEKDKIIAEQDLQLKLLPDFEKQRADWVKRIEEEHTAAQIQFERANEKEEEARALESEVERLKVKAEEAALSLERLQTIEKQLEVLRRPWWKKWFLPVSGDEQECKSD